jgi:sulfoxide reductase heme-binding subunit YedZ
VSLILFSAVVVLGILASVRVQSAAWPRFLTTGLHRNLALLAVVFLGLHIVTAVVDPFVSLGFGAAAIPFSSPYRRLWLGLGVVALDLLLAIVITSLMRPLLGHRAWRAVHWLAYVSWPVAVIHGLAPGVDAGHRRRLHGDSRRRGRAATDPTPRRHAVRLDVEHRWRDGRLR